MFFRLFDYCHMVAGAKRGALYNTQTGKVLSVNKGALELLAACQSQNLEELMDIQAESSQTYIQFLQNLASKGFGTIYITAPPDASAKSVEPLVPSLEFLWLELTSNCNNRCLHCYASSGPCESKVTLPHERWMSLIGEARQAGATAIQLIGGEPMLYSGWRELALEARAKNYDLIEIFTNGTLITDADIAFFKQNNIHIATTIYAADATMHDRITLHNGSFNKTYESIKKIQAAAIPLRIASIIMKPNENEADDIMKLCSELGVEVNPPDVVRPTGRGDDTDLLPQNYTKPPIKPPFYTDAQSFAHNQHYHSCLAGKLAITSEGDVIPCIFARNQICGNVLTQSLSSILQGEPLQHCWTTTKDHVEKCKDCEYRYACTDCRPLAQGSDTAKKWLACSKGCLYDPHTGIWAINKDNS